MVARGARIRIDTRTLLARVTRAAPLGVQGFWLSRVDLASRHRDEHTGQAGDFAADSTPSAAEPSHARRRTALLSF